MKKRSILRAITLLSLVVLSLTLVGLPSRVRSTQAPKEIVIGASIPKSGVLAAFGSYEEWGYSTAVAEVNKAGGILLKDFNQKVQVKLILYDDESLPQKATQNTERLILKDEVHALLGSATPPLVISGAVVAERQGIPMVTGIAPLRAFLSAQKWTVVWDIFFDEMDMTEQQFLTADLGQTNRKVALFTDNEQDGVVMGGLWEKQAPKFKYEVVYRANFPVGTTDYGDLIRKAKAAQAEIVICQMITPDSIALWKQMQALDYRPKAIFFEKGGEPVEWWKALGKSAQGTMVAGYWHPNLGFPGAADLRKRFETETKQTYSQHIADTYTAAQVLLDAIAAAGSVDPKAINAAIAKTDKTYVVGPIRFNIGLDDGPASTINGKAGDADPAKAPAPGGLGSGKQGSALPIFMLQWQDGDLQIVYPAKLATGKLMLPLPPWSEVK